MPGRDNETEESGLVKIKCELKKTMQERQYEPFDVSCSMEKVVPADKVEDGFSEMYVELEETITAMFAERGMDWKRK